MPRFVTHGEGATTRYPTIGVVILDIADSGDDGDVVRRHVEETAAELIADLVEARARGTVQGWDAPPARAWHTWESPAPGQLEEIKHHAFASQTIRFVDADECSRFIARFPSGIVVVREHGWELDGSALEEAQRAARAEAVADAKQRARDFALAAGTPEPALVTLIEQRGAGADRQAFATREVVTICARVRATFE